MSLHLINLAPSFLKEQDLAYSEIWRKDWAWDRGEKIRISAPSGKGKTTLVHILYGLNHDYAGDVLYSDRSLRALKDHEQALLRRKTVAVVFQDMRLFPNLTGWENIEVKAALSPDTDMTHVRHQADRLGLAETLDKPSGKLSQGEQQRIAIVRALAQPFDWILLDEPFSHLDSDTAQVAADLIAGVCKERGAGCLFTSLGDENHLPFDVEHAL